MHQREHQDIRDSLKIIPYLKLSMNLKKLPREFYLQPTVSVARKLLGKFIVRKLGVHTLIGKIVETEAYCRHDPASHSFNGIGERNRVMFNQGGYLYVYFTYGMHFCANVVTGPEGKGEAALIRAVEPILGTEEMSRRRKMPADDHRLTNGPAKFTQAFALGRTENGIDLLGDKIFIAEGDSETFKIGSSSRVGISSAKDKKWRFFIKENPWVSR
jgi:DNA-3-methyladenine glycosylase